VGRELGTPRLQSQLCSERHSNPAPGRLSRQAHRE
jgi:hypothetical protein